MELAENPLFRNKPAAAALISAFLEPLFVALILAKNIFYKTNAY
jgi:hypothetical protein